MNGSVDKTEMCTIHQEKYSTNVKVVYCHHAYLIYMQSTL